MLFGINYLIAIAEMIILVIRDILPRLINPIRVPGEAFIPSGIIPVTQYPIHPKQQHTSRQRRDIQHQPVEVPGCVLCLPQLWATNARHAVADEEQGVDNGALGIAFCVGGAETEDYNHDRGDAGCLILSATLLCGA